VRPIASVLAALALAACRETTGPHVSVSFASLSAGAGHTCGLTADGTAYCWGFGSWSPAPVSRALTFARVSAGEKHICGSTASGVAYCWGDNRAGQLGNGRADTLPHSTPVMVSGGLTFASVSAGGLHTCGVTTGGIAYCWGYDYFGQLGSGDTTNSATPVAVVGGRTFATVSAGGDFTCGVTTGGSAYCWGDNAWGGLGAGSSDLNPHPAPVAVSGGFTFMSLSAGLEHACGMTTGGAAYCWGDNSHDQLGVFGGDGCGGYLSIGVCRLVPTAVSGGLTFGSLRTGGEHTCGVTTGGAVYCWGNNDYQQLGTTYGPDVCGFSGEFGCSIEPTPVSGGLTFASVTAGGWHTCGVTTGGLAYCWGDNRNGQLGDGSRTQSATPVRVAGQP